MTETGRGRPWPNRNSSSDWTSGPPRSAWWWANSPEGVDVVGIGTAQSNGCARAWSSTSNRPCSPSKRPWKRPNSWPGARCSVYAGIAGSHIKGFNSHGSSPSRAARWPSATWSGSSTRPRRGHPAGPRGHPHPAPGVHRGRPAGIADPLGMAGVRLEVKVHIVTGAVTSAQNIIRSCHGPGSTSRTSCSNPWPRPRPS